MNELAFSPFYHAGQSLRSLMLSRAEGRIVSGVLCSNCHNLVDKHQGCDHISCPCGHEFCWRCGNSWQHYEHPCHDKGRVVSAFFRFNWNFLPSITFPQSSLSTSQFVHFLSPEFAPFRHCAHQGTRRQTFGQIGAQIFRRMCRSARIAPIPRAATPKANGQNIPRRAQKGTAMDGQVCSGE